MLKKISKTLELFTSSPTLNSCNLRISKRAKVGNTVLKRDMEKEIVGKVKRKSLISSGKKAMHYYMVSRLLSSDSKEIIARSKTFSQIQTCPDFQPQKRFISLFMGH